MNYDQRFRELIADIKADKTIAQPWRNKSIGRIDEAQALLEKGQRVSYMQEPPGAAESFDKSQGAAAIAALDNANHSLRGLYPGSVNPECICPAGGIHTACPIHGTMK